MAAANLIDFNAAQLIVGCLSGAICSVFSGGLLLFILKSQQQRIKEVENEAETKINLLDSKMAERIEKLSDSFTDRCDRILIMIESLDSKKTDKELCQIISANFEKIFSENAKTLKDNQKGMVSQGEVLAKIQQFMEDMK